MGIQIRDVRSRCNGQRKEAPSHEVHSLRASRMARASERLALNKNKEALDKRASCTLPNFAFP